MSDPVNDPVPPGSLTRKDPFPWTDWDMCQSFLYGACFGVAVVMAVLAWI